MMTVMMRGVVRCCSGSIGQITTTTATGGDRVDTVQTPSKVSSPILRTGAFPTESGNGTVGLVLLLRMTVVGTEDEA